MEPEIKVDFLIAGNFDPEEITNVLGISPTKSWKKGDLISGTTIARKFDGWILSAAERSDSNEVEEHIKPLLTKLLPLKDRIAEVYKEFELEAEINCAVYVTDETPVLYMSAVTLREISELNASVDIDIILLDPE